MAGITFFYRPDTLPVIQTTMSKHWKNSHMFL